MKRVSRVFQRALVLLLAVPLPGTGRSGPCPWPALQAPSGITLDATDSEPLRYFRTRKMRYYSRAKRIGSSDIKPASRITVE
jgi:hypothetical protein